MADGATNWFDQGGADYARYRPDYPDDLAQYLASLAPDRDLAVDVGCGNGQFTCQLGDHFGAVIGLDPSADQIAHAAPHHRVRYACAPAEALPLPDRSASLVTAAQAAHWFDLPAFYGEARRIATQGAIIALVSYGVCQLEPEINGRFLTFYRQEIGRYWPPERRLVDSGYADIDFPFATQAAPAMAIRRTWTAAEFLGYVSTWSATRRALDAGQEALLADFARDLLALWSDPAQARPVQWPISVRAGRL